MAFPDFSRIARIRVTGTTREMVPDYRLNGSVPSGTIVPGTQAASEQDTFYCPTLPYSYVS